MIDENVNIVTKTLNGEIKSAPFKINEFHLGNYKDTADGIKVANQLQLCRKQLNEAINAENYEHCRKWMHVQQKNGPSDYPMLSHVKLADLLEAAKDGLNGANIANEADEKKEAYSNTKVPFASAPSSASNNVHGFDSKNVNERKRKRKWIDSYFERVLESDDCLSGNESGSESDSESDSYCLRRSKQNLSKSRICPNNKENDENGDGNVGEKKVEKNKKKKTECWLDKLSKEWKEPPTKKRKRNKKRKKSKNSNTIRKYFASQ